MNVLQHMCQVIMVMYNECIILTTFYFTNMKQQTYLRHNVNHTLTRFYLSGHKTSASN